MKSSGYRERFDVLGVVDFRGEEDLGREEPFIRDIRLLNAVAVSFNLNVNIIEIGNGKTSSR